MVIIICFGANCQALWENIPYDSETACLQNTKSVASYMQEAYPNSSGEIYCMTQMQFDKFYKDLEDGMNLNLQYTPETDKPDA
jgi:heterodisulfide reductase subunit A-like polyferredoxin|tara:strand:+ start:606 stop:854 length:249 start_codon:yes stop_codon:yes gene_type:complete